jgi:hypothetical protein
VRIEFLILADAAQVAGGKLFILGGGWSVYRSPAYPAQIQLALGLSILIDWQEAGIRYPVSITIADEAGVPVIPELRGEVEVGKSPEVPPGTTQRALFPLNTVFAVPRAGKYVVTATAGTSRAQTFFDAIFAGTAQMPIPPEPGLGRGN